MRGREGEKMGGRFPGKKEYCTSSNYSNVLLI